MKLTSFSWALPRRAVLLAGVLVTVLSVGSFNTATQPVLESYQCSQDWAAAIAAREAGAAEYSGPCTSFGGFGPTDEIPADFYSTLAEWQRRFEIDVAIVRGSVWEMARKEMGGLPLILGALMIGALVTGSTLGSGMAAWTTSNGWSRRQWALANVGFTTVVTIVGYLVLGLLFTIAVGTRLQALGTSPWPGLPHAGFFAPLGGLLFYGLLGVAVGTITRRADAGVLAALLVAVGEYVIQGAFGGAPFFPSTLHQIALGNSGAGPSVGAALAGLLGAAVALGALSFSLLLRRDLPDRSTA